MAIANLLINDTDTLSINDNDSLLISSAVAKRLYGTSLFSKHFGTTSVISKTFWHNIGDYKMTTSFYPGELADIFLYVKDSDGVAFDPDSVDKLQIFSNDRTQIGVDIESDITNPAVGTYKYVYNMPNSLTYPYIIARWEYTHGSVTDVEEVKANIKGA